MPGPYRIFGLTPRGVAIALLVVFLWFTLVVLSVVPGSWAARLFEAVDLVIGPPVRALDALMDQPPSGWVATALWVLFWPGYLLLLGVERILHAFGISSAVLTSGWALVPVALTAVVPSWIVWSFILVRAWHFLGLWDPFRTGHTQGRRFILQAMIRIREWAEIGARFGKGATGQWATLPEVLSNRWLPGDIFLGRPKLGIGGMMRPVGLPTERHVITIGATGSSKSTAGLIPNLCIHGDPAGSMVVIDPKGELAMITAGRRGQGGNGVAGIGQDVHVLDPFGIVPGWKSAAYNVFDELARVAESDPDRPVSYAGKIAQALVRREGERDPYWNDSATTLLRGLILHVFVNEPPERRTLGRLRELIMEGDVEEHRAAVKRGEIKEDDLDPFEVLLKKMQRSREGPYGGPIAGAAHTIFQMARPQRGSVLSTAQEQTSFLDAPEMQRVSARSDFLLSELKDRPISVYLCLPLPAVTGKEGRWLRMFVMLLIDMMMRETKKPEHPILLAIDEFPSLGKLEGVELVAPVLRSYGVRFWAVAQDIDQLRAVYPETWAGFLGNAECVQFMGIKHPATVDLIVKLLGRHEIVADAKRKLKAERQLLEPDQVSKLLARGNQIIWRGHARPLLLKTAPYFWYMPGWYYDRDPRYPEKWNRRMWRTNGGPPEPPRPDRPPEKPDDVFTRMAEWKPPAPPEPPPGYVAPDEDDPFLRTAKTPWSEMIMDGERKEDNGPRRDYSEAWVKKLEQERRAADVPLPGEVEDADSGLDELEAMIGLDDVKLQVSKLASLMKLQKARRGFGKPDLNFSYHLVFTGNPGTGKTTVARIIGRIYREMGLLKKGHLVETNPAGMIAGYIGQTALKTEEVVKNALDGVLFIDEAYDLVSENKEDTFGKQAVATLVKMMEDHRDRLAVIVAGYPGEMRRLIEANPGIASRFKTTIHFPDYNVEDLTKIFDKIAADAGCRLSMDARVKVRDRLEAIKKAGGESFGNGRDVRNLFEDVLARQAGRLAGKKNLKEADVTMLEAGDIPAG